MNYMKLSYFAAEPYLQSRDQHLMLGSSIIRAQQIAEYLGAKYNPRSGWENDVCIWVKPDLEAESAYVKTAGSKTYLDMIDYSRYVHWLRDHPNERGIVSSQFAYDILKEEMPGRIVLIPQQHCNFENFVRRRKKIANVGVIGSPRSFKYPLAEIGKRLEQIGLRLITNFNFQTRQDVTDFYKKIDIQIIWYTRRMFLKTPLKIINAASFGIPSVAAPHDGYKEVDDYYLKARTIDQLISEVKRLKNPQNYKAATKNLLGMAAKYHIKKIAKLYKQLV